MDRRIQKTKEAIYEAYFKLLKEKKDERITVAELTRLANIDRKTFYLHYGNIDDVLVDFCDEKVEEFLDRLKETDFNENPLHMKVMVDILNNMLKRDREYFVLLSLNNYHLFWEKIHDILADALIKFYAEKVVVSREEMKLYCDFFISGMIRVYQDYLNDSNSYTASMIEKIIVDISYNGITKVLKV